MKLQSKFPYMETTIFSTVSKMSHKLNALNLGQGFPDFEGDAFLFDRLNYYTHNGYNQYAPMNGMLKLRRSIVDMQKRLYGQNLHIDDEITVTSGATAAIFCAISTVTHPGDEVILLDPCFDSYVPNIELSRGVPVRVNLKDDFSIDWNKVEDAVSEKTKLIVLNYPHNPSGKVLTKQDLDSLWQIIKDKNIFVINDEVYQHIIFDGHLHLSPFCDERFYDRTFAVSSFGKTFSVTGWKIGYCLACPELMKEFRKVHQYVNFCSMSSCQMAISDMMDKKPNYYEKLAQIFQKKRDLFCDGLKKTKFKFTPAEGSYFQQVDYSEYSDLGDWEYCQKLMQEPGVASIPISVFYEKPPKGQKIIRFCFAKKNEVLIKANSILQAM